MANEERNVTEIQTITHSKYLLLNWSAERLSRCFNIDTRVRLAAAKGGDIIKPTHSTNE